MDKKGMGVRDVIAAAVLVVAFLSMPVQAQTTAVRSPDGRTLAYTVALGSPKTLMTEVWIAGADGGGRRRIRTYPGAAGDLGFLPDGKGLVYLERGLSYAAFGSHLYGGHELSLVRNRVWTLDTGGPGEALWPLPGDLQPLGIAVSPDGERLAVGGYRGTLPCGGDAGLWAVDRQGNATRLLSGRVKALVWPQDSERIYCTVEGAGHAGRVAVHAVTGRVERLDAGQGVAGLLAPGTEGREAALSPRQRADTEAALGLLAGGLDLYLKGYHAAHRGNYRKAGEAYRQAIREFEAVESSHRMSGMSGAAVAAYVRTLRSRADMEDAARRAAVCREHLLVLGDLMTQDAGAHGGALPPDLDSLRAWAERRIREGASHAAVRARDLSVLSQLFRCPADPNPERRISYAYRPDVSGNVQVLSCFWHRGEMLALEGRPGAWRATSSALQQAQIDSLAAAAGRHLKAGAADRAIALLEVVVHQRPGDASARIQLGHACLAAGDDVRAERAFDGAVSISKGKTLAGAYYGMGLVYARRPRELYRAIGYFRDALRRDRDYVDARYQMALARYLLWEYDAKGDIEKVLKMDPNYADAYMLMGDWYANLKEDFEQAIPWYTKYLSMRPKDPEGRERLSRAYLKVKDYDRVMETLLGFVREHPDAIELMPIVAQACVKQGKLDMGLGFYRAYLSRLSPQERALYEDIGLIASKEELAKYAQASGAQRERFLRQFWYERDPDLSTPVNERLLEHYRRVWFARQTFAGGGQPWDRRGEIYIRFGEPDHRTTSLMMNAKQSLAVQRVKERMAHDMYGARAVGETYIGPVFPVRSQVMAGRRFDDEGLETGELAEVNVEDADVEQQAEDPGALNKARETIKESEKISEDAPGIASGFAGDIRPSDFAFMAAPDLQIGEYGPVTASSVDVSRVPWESWVYTRIGGGIELTFTDETHRGTYDYAPVPLATEFSTGQIARFARYAPRTLAERAIAVSPDLYVPEYGAPFDFYFDLADFRGRDGRSALEVYYGVPNRAARYVDKEDVTRMVVDRQIALISAAFDTVYRAGGDLVYEVPGRHDGNGAFVPDVVRVEVPPGPYKLEVRARNRLNGRLGIYRKDVAVEAYGPEQLRLSDLELAWRISEGRPGGKFSKGDVQVIPIPTRLFRRGQSVYVYYEIYNLARDEFGRTKYQVAYTIAPQGGGIISRLVRTLTGRRGKMSVGYEQLGFGESETAYVELDLSAGRAGRHRLKVEVTDLNSGQKAEKTAAFIVAE